MTFAGQAYALKWRWENSAESMTQKQSRRCSSLVEKDQVALFQLYAYVRADLASTIQSWREGSTSR